MFDCHVCANLTPIESRRSSTALRVGESSGFMSSFRTIKLALGFYSNTKRQDIVNGLRAIFSHRPNRDSVFLTCGRDATNIKPIMPKHCHAAACYYIRPGCAANQNCAIFAFSGGNCIMVQQYKSANCHDEK